MKNSLWLLLAILVGNVGLLAQPAGRFTYQGLSAADRQRVDSLCRVMSLEEKVGQMFVPAVFLQTPAQVSRALYLIDSCRVGGVSLYRNDPEAVLDFLAQAQQHSRRVPLLPAMTLERGLAMRLDGTFGYPWPLTMGALGNDTLVYRVGRHIGEVCRQMGIYANFAPSADVNTEPENPIIGVRSFGEDPHRVAGKVAAFVRGMQDAGVLASVKHFPGHGATRTDSHKELPVLPFSARRLEEVELHPFEKACRSGVASVMTGHLYVPAFDSVGERPSSLSERIVGGILRRAWNYQGLVITDALNMRGVSGRYGCGEAEIEAILAGNDLLLYSEDTETAYRAVLAAVKQGRISRERIEQSVRRILAAKCAAGILEGVPPRVNSLALRVARGTERDSALCLDVMERAVTLLHNREHALPLADAVDTVCYLPLGAGESGDMVRYMGLYAPVKVLDRQASAARILEQSQGRTLVVGYHGGSPAAFTPGKVEERDRALLDSLAAAPGAVLVWLDNPYALLQLEGWKRYPAAVLAYENLWAANLAAAEVLHGAVAPKGKLPVSLGEGYPRGTGETFRPLGRLKFGFPSQEGIDPEKLGAVDSLLADIVATGSAPGGRLVVARGGRVVIDRCFGTTMYGDSLSRAVTPGTVYDLASVTKVSATLPLIMQLYDRGKIHFSSRLEDMVPAYRGSNKGKVLLKELLAHNGGLPAGLPFYSYTLDKNTKEPSEFFYADAPSPEYPLEVAEGLYMRASYPDTVTARLRKCALRPKRMVYSDLDFYLLREVVDRYYPEGIEQAALGQVFRPLGALTMGFRPLLRMSADSIAPSANDTLFRRQLLRGYVHDSGAALLGGVSGHAGNFSSAYDLAKYGQMLLQKGYYGGYRFFSEQTVDRFTRYAYATASNSRSAGFVKKAIGAAPDHFDACVSSQAYWHTGFTGTMLLVEPEQDLVYVLLTNRTYGEKKANAFSDGGYRFGILEAILGAIDGK